MANFFPSSQVIILTNDQLPQVWIEYYDRVSGHEYYVNNTLGITQWEFPPSFQVFIVTNNQLPQVWIKYYDPVSGHEYYVNNTLGITQWEFPTFQILPPSHVPPPPPPPPRYPPPIIVAPTPSMLSPISGRKKVVPSPVTGPLPLARIVRPLNTPADFAAAKALMRQHSVALTTAVANPTPANVAAEQQLAQSLAEYIPNVDGSETHTPDDSANVLMKLRAYTRLTEYAHKSANGFLAGLVGEILIKYGGDVEETHDCQFNHDASMAAHAAYTDAINAGVSDDHAIMLSRFAYQDFINLANADMDHILKLLKNLASVLWEYIPIDQDFFFATYVQSVDFTQPFPEDPGEGGRILKKSKIRKIKNLKKSQKKYRSRK